MRLPAARPRFPEAAAEIVIATSGRLPASERKISPPMSSPSPSRASSASVVFESIVPAAQVAPAPARKMTRRSAEESPPTPQASRHRRTERTSAGSSYRPMSLLVSGLEDGQVLLHLPV